MKRTLFLLMIFFMLAGCANPTPSPIVTPTIAPPTQPPSTETPTATAAPTKTATPEATATPEILAPIKIVTNLESLSQADVVADGQEAEYAKRILAAYKSGQIENFDSSIVPPKITMGDAHVFRDETGYQSDFSPHLEEYYNTPVKDRPERIVVFVQDGQGGYRVIQLWLQKDKTPGSVWYYIPKNTNVAYSHFEEIISGKYYNTAVVPGEFKDERSCTSLTGDAASCTVLMTLENVSSRRAALQEWVDTGFIPEAMQNGSIQFPLGFLGL